jgi:hypothetical protein
MFSCPISRSEPSDLPEFAPMPRRALSLGLVLVLAGWAAAQAAPAVPTLGTGSQPPAQETPVLHPLIFQPELPTDPVAWIDEAPIPASMLLRTILEQNFSTGVTALVMSKIADLELAKAGIELQEPEIREELESMLAQMAPGKTLADLEKDGSTSIHYLMANARATRAWKKLFWTAQKVPEDQQNNQTNMLLLQFFMKTATDDYERRIRGSNPAPAPGSVAHIIQKSTGNEYFVGASECLDFLMGLVRPAGILEALDEVIDHALVDRELARAGKTVTDEEVAAFAAEMRVKYPPPFAWDQICRVRGTTPEREMERWRRIQAMKRVTGFSPTEEELDGFLNENKSFFTGKTKKVSHILLRTTDEVTGLPLPEDAQKEAERQIGVLAEKLAEGVDFGWLAETYSQDSVTAKGKGRMGSAIRQWGGGLDPAFVEAVWRLESPGEISAPVRSAHGWHLIKLEEVSDPRPKQEPDWREPRFQEYIQDEYETKLMSRYVQGLREKARIRKAPTEQLIALKHRSYFQR